MNAKNLESLVNALTSAGLNNDETIMFCSLVDFWNMYCDVEKLNPQDLDEACGALHLLQDKLLARPALRQIRKAGH